MKTIASRETAFTALFTWLQTNTGSNFKTFTRRLKHWNDCSEQDCPAMYMTHTGETTQPLHGQPPRIVLELELWFYVKTYEKEVGPIVNPLIDVIGTALEPNNNGENTQTLGGIVHHCWIEGQTVIYEGNLGDEAVVTIPVKILVT